MVHGFYFRSWTNFCARLWRTGQLLYAKTNGGGIALFDFDKDGLLDIFLVQDGGPNSIATNKLFRQAADHRFEDVGPKSNLEYKGFCQGVAVGDVNNDSWPDVLITEYGGVHLWLNSGDGSFEDVTECSALDNPLWATSASFVDYDRDGWLDVVVVNYVQYSDEKACSPKGG